MPRLDGEDYSEVTHLLGHNQQQMAVMRIRCAQSLKISYSGTLLVTLKNQVVMNATMVLLHKSGRSMGLTCWYRLFRRDLYIRSWNSYLRWYRVSNAL